MQGQIRLAPPKGNALEAQSPTHFRRESVHGGGISRYSPMKSLRFFMGSRIDKGPLIIP